VDVTPRTKKVSLAARGSEMISRGTFERYLRDHDPKRDLGPGQKQAMHLLKTDRPALLKPQNAHLLDAIQRTQPGDKLHTAIYSDPQAAHQHQMLKQSIAHNIATLSPSVARPRPQPPRAHDPLAASIQQQAQQQQQMLARPTSLERRQAGFAAMPNTDWVSKLAGEAFSTYANTPAFLYRSVTHPVGTAKQMGPAIVKSYTQFGHPIRYLQNDPLGFMMAGPGTLLAGAGLGGRVLESGAALGRAGAADVALAPEQAANQAVRANALMKAATNQGSYSRVTRLVPGSMPMTRAAVHGFTHPKIRNVFDAYDQFVPHRRDQLAAERQAMIDQMHEHGILQQADEPQQHVLWGDQPAPPQQLGPKPSRRSLGEAWQAYKDEVNQRRLDTAAAHAEAKAAKGGPIWANVKRGVRETTDLMRFATIYARLGYLPNNWLSNEFMNLTHQGPLAPVNQVKAGLAAKNFHPAELAIMRHATGDTSAAAMERMGGRGTVRAFTDPIARVMGRYADQPFRDTAFLHEARRQGLHTLDDVQQLLQRAHGGDQAALHQVADIGLKAQEHVVKFKKFSPEFQSFARQALFIYNWIHGSTRYAARYPFVHPAQFDIQHIGAEKVAKPWIQSQLGGNLPPFMAGTIPIGGGRVIRPMTLSPLTSVATPVQVAQALQKIASGHGDPQSRSDALQMLNPVWAAIGQTFIGSGGRSLPKNLVRGTAPARLIKGLMHPGSGSIYPTSRMEAVGSNIFGSAYPVRMDPTEARAMFARMNIAHPEALIGQQIKDYYKATGIQIPQAVTAGYKRAIPELAAQKKFQADWAHSNNATSWRKLLGKDPKKAMEGAINYIDQHHMQPKEVVAQYRQVMNQLQYAEDARSYANDIFTNSTGDAHSFKSLWDQYMAEAKSQKKLK